MESIRRAQLTPAQQNLVSSLAARIATMTSVCDPLKLGLWARPDYGVVSGGDGASDGASDGGGGDGGGGGGE